MRVGPEAAHSERSAHAPMLMTSGPLGPFRSPLASSSPSRRAAAQFTAEKEAAAAQRSDAGGGSGGSEERQQARQPRPSAWRK
jgi:hypothetical protein